MSTNGQDDAGDVVGFQELDQDDGEGDQPSKLEQALAFLGDKLEAKDLGEFKKILGLAEDISNAELLEKFKELLAAKNGDDDGDDDDDKGGDYKAFIKKCMGEGEKSLKECADEWKEKYPEAKASDEDITEMEALEITLKKKDDDKDDDKKDDDEYPEPVKKKMAELQSEIDSLKNLNRAKDIDTKVDAMVSGKHMTPKQAGEVKKLMADLPDERHAEILDLFSGQVITVKDDVGRQPGAEAMTAERRKALIKDHGIDRLMKDLGGELPE